MPSNALIYCTVYHGVFHATFLYLAYVVHLLFTSIERLTLMAFVAYKGFDSFLTYNWNPSHYQLFVNSDFVQKKSYYWWVLFTSGALPDDTFALWRLKSIFLFINSVCGVFRSIITDHRGKKVKEEWVCWPGSTPVSFLSFSCVILS